MQTAVDLDRPRRPVRDDLHDIAPAVAWVTEQVAPASLDAETQFAIDLCLEEALANLVLHGVPQDGDKDIMVGVRLEPGACVLTISDRCAPYDAVSAVLPEPGGFEEGAAEGGRGLKLMRGFASDLAYESLGGRNVLTLRFAAGA
jgi:anti-sigma regulatory factor (Ser/Thr protein kinase)